MVTPTSGVNDHIPVCRLYSNDAGDIIVRQQRYLDSFEWEFEIYLADYQGVYHYQDCWILPEQYNKQEAWERFIIEFNEEVG